MKRPQIVGHRGAPREHRENTLASFARALDGGADALELDVHLTLDGAVVVHHDPLLHPLVAGGSRPAVARLALADVRALTPPDRPVPTLDDVLELVGQRATLYVEVKASEATDAVVAALHEHETPAAIHAFDHRVVRRVRELDPRLPTGVLMSSYLLDPIVPVAQTGARDLWQEASMIDAPLVESAHAAGARVVAWTVNDLEVATRLAAWGVDALCTDLAPAFAAHFGASPRV
jgi:glycerophosphoryl diester phosphodiesterase